MKHNKKLQEKAAKKAQKRMRKYNRKPEKEILIEEFTCLEKNEREQMIQRGNGEMDVNTGMAPIFAYFPL